MLFQQGEKKKEGDVGNRFLLLNRNNSSEAPNISNHPPLLSGRYQKRSLGEVSDKERKAELIHFPLFNIVSEALETITGPGALGDPVRFKDLGKRDGTQQENRDPQLQSGDRLGRSFGVTRGDPSHELPGLGTPGTQKGGWNCPEQLQPPSPRRGWTWGWPRCPYTCKNVILSSA